MNDYESILGRLHLALHDPTYVAALQRHPGDDKACDDAHNSVVRRITQVRDTCPNPTLFDEMARTWNGTAEQLAQAISDATI